VGHDATNRFDNPFWRYSLVQYSVSSHAEILLQGQSLGLDVNLLLLCGYLAHTKQCFTEGFPHLSIAQEWQTHHVIPIRALRMRLKPFDKDWYEAMKQVELEAEQIEQWILFEGSKLNSRGATSNEDAQVDERIEKNLRNYIAHTGCEVSEDTLHALVKCMQCKPS